MNKRISYLLFFGTFLFGSMQAAALPSLGIDSCLAMAVKHFPLSRQQGILSKALPYSLDNLSKGYLPQVQVLGAATWQSEVTRLPFTLPNMQVQGLSKDQYRLYAELNQGLTDMVLIKDQKQQAKHLWEVEKQKNEVELYATRERVAQLYFGILLLQQQCVQQDLYKKDLSTQRERLQVAYTQGTLLRSQVLQMDAERISCEEKITELQSALQSYRVMLGAFINQSLDEHTVLEWPVLPETYTGNFRPELKLFELQSSLVPLQEQLLRNKNLPRLNLFAQGGYGRPALNMLNNDFRSYFVGGLRLQWNLSGWYTYRRDWALLELNMESVEVQKAVFLFNHRLKESQLQAEREKAKQLMQQDEELLKVRTQIKEGVQQQVQLGTATASDLILSMDAEDKARTLLLLHKLQWLMNQYSLKIHTGN